MQIPECRPQLLRDRIEELERAARALLDELRAERRCCDDCTALGEPGWWTAAELRLAAAINGDR